MSYADTAFWAGYTLMGLALLASIYRLHRLASVLYVACSIIFALITAAQWWS